MLRAAIWFLFGGAASVNAASPALPIDLNLAILALNQTFDPRSDPQWGARCKPVPGGDPSWMARHAVNAERIRSILTSVYYRGPLRLGNSGAALLVIEAARSKGVAEMDLMVSKSVFQELQRTLKAPQGVRLLYPDPRGLKDEFRLNVLYENR